jgi:hypothetical protein
MNSVKFLFINNAFFHASIRTAVVSKLKDEALSELEVKMWADLYELIWANVYEPLSSELNKK